MFKFLIIVFRKFVRINIFDIIIPCIIWIFVYSLSTNSNTYNGFIGHFYFNSEVNLNYLLQLGFTPTQIVDSFAIAFGGASFYRNRFNTYKKQGMTDKQASDKAMLDFQEIAEETQQSSREDMVSQQQASVLGRVVLAFQNTTMQYTRLTKKSLSDLVNRRGDPKTHISKIAYYGAVQTIVFLALQQALAQSLWGDDEEELDKDLKRVFNGALDSFLTGTGIHAIKL